ncbi:hypothetical protein J3R75_000676 [Oligosphaera ethanolica]|uniref:Uncharacterized protein n=1 Tax=Oligosphaera ethanolica TaxID=760260 RepID=A0AAE3VDM5_9BACT|nr:hypothetical protein [Oligosphaera ethanolica]
MRRRYFFLTRRREGAKKTKARKNGGMSCRCAAIHAAGKKSRRRGGPMCPPVFLFSSREGAKARRRQRQGRMAACLAAGKKALLLSHAKARRREFVGADLCVRPVFIRRFRRLPQILAACLAAARQFTPPFFVFFAALRLRVRKNESGGRPVVPAARAGRTVCGCGGENSYCGLLKLALGCVTMLTK